MIKLSHNKEILSSVTNALKILRLYTPKQQELSFTEIIRKLDLSKGTGHRLISTLVKEGFLSKNPRTNHYRLGLAILGLGGTIFSHRELFREAIPIVKKLSSEIQETTHICLLENDKVAYLFRCESNQPDRLVTQIGRTNPLHCTSEGLCLLAFQKESFIQDFLKKPLYAYTPYTITQPEKLYELLQEIKVNNYCYLDSTYFLNYTSVSVPIRNHLDKVVATLSVIGHSSRFTKDNREKIIKKMKEAANHISENLGYYP